MDWRRFWPWFANVISGFGIGVIVAWQIGDWSVGRGAPWTHATPAIAAILVSSLVSSQLPKWAEQRMDWLRFCSWLVEVVGGFGIGVIFAALVEYSTGVERGVITTYALPYGAAGIFVSSLLRIWLRSKKQG